MLRLRIAAPGEATVRRKFPGMSQAGNSLETLRKIPGLVSTGAHANLAVCSFDPDAASPLNVHKVQHLQKVHTYEPA
jgi:hypothetical protein